MAPPLSREVIIENFKLLSEWLAIKHPGKQFDIVVAGGAALALQGTKSATLDVDVLEPTTLPNELREASQAVARAKGLGPNWLSTGVARVLATVGKQVSSLPDYFSERTPDLEIAANLRVKLVGRQTLISLKLLAASPSERKHIEDLRSMQPTREELDTAASFVRSVDSSEPRREDLTLIFEEILRDDQ